MKAINPGEPLTIASLGLCSPVGLTARSTQAEIAAGTMRIFQTDVMDSWGEPVRASSLTLLSADDSRSHRMASLAFTAFMDCMQKIQPAETTPLPMVLALPEPESGAPLDDNIITHALLEAKTGWRLQLADDGLIPAGRAAFFQALCRAGEMLSSSRYPFVLVGAVDSLCDRQSLRMLAGSGRTLGGPNREGIIPGEGAGFILLAHPRQQNASDRSARASVLACTHTSSKRPFRQSQPALGDGLTEAFRRLRAHPRAGSRRVDFFLSCQPMESFWGQEFTYAYLRNGALLPEPLEGESLAGSLGDPGAAAGALQVGMAMHSRSEGPPERPGPWRTLVYGCSDNGLVGACVVEAHT